MKVLAIKGSLREGAFSTSVLNAAMKLAPEGMEFVVADLSEIPLYNEDVKKQGFPESVQKFRDQIKAADGLLISSPEYNYSIPGFLKNALDWASRPPEPPAVGKTMAFMTSSPGLFGGVRAHPHMRQLALAINLLTLGKPEVSIPKVKEKLDANGELTDEATKEAITKMLVVFKDFTRKMQG